MYGQRSDELSRVHLVQAGDGHNGRPQKELWFNLECS